MCTQMLANRHSDSQLGANDGDQRSINRNDNDLQKCIFGIGCGCGAKWFRRVWFDTHFADAVNSTDSLRTDPKIAIIFRTLSVLRNR